MNTNITKTWEIDINENEVFSRCTNESLYQSYRRTAGAEGAEQMAMTDDDRAQFRVYYENAIANLHMILSRRIDENMADYCMDCGCVSFYLQMHDNHDNNMLPILINHCYDYVVKKVLEQWYNINFGSELAKLEIKHCLHYRKNPVRRRIGPLF